VRSVEHADAELNRAVELLNDGLSATDIAAEMGVSRATGYRLRKRAIEQGLLEV
jgi:transposase